MHILFETHFSCLFRNINVDFLKVYLFSKLASISLKYKIPFIAQRVLEFGVPNEILGILFWLSNCFIEKTLCYISLALKRQERMCIKMCIVQNHIKGLSLPIQTIKAKIRPYIYLL